MARWMIDPDHSVVAFSVKHMMITNVRGLFTKISGAIQFDPPEMSHVSVEVEIDVASLTTGIRKRDEHLFSPDFLDLERYPKIIFRSTGAEALGGNRCRVAGDLTIRGTTRAVTLEVEYFGPVTSPFGGETTIGFSATTSLNRYDYTVAWHEPMEKGEVAGENVEITLDIEADLAAD